jgi:hypothetical protein
MVATIPLYTHSSIRRLIARVVLIGVIGGSAALFAFQPTQVFGEPVEDVEQSSETDEMQSHEDYWESIE